MPADPASPRTVRAHTWPPGRHAQRRELHPCLRALSWRFERRGIRWCALDEGPVPGVRGGTLRILVAPDDRERAEQAVRAASGVVLAGHRRAAEGLWLLRDPSGGTTVVLQPTTRLGGHLGEDVSRRLVHAVLLNRTRGEVPRVAGTERFWLVLLGVQPGGRPPPSRMSTLRSLARTHAVETSPLAPLVALLGDDWTVRRVTDALEAGDPIPAPLAHPVRRFRRSLPRWLDRLPTFRGRASTPGLTVIVIDPAGDFKRRLLADPPAWPAPVEVIDAAPTGHPRRTATGSRVRESIHAALRLLRARAATSRGRLVILTHTSAEDLLPPVGAPRTSMFAALLLSQVEAVLLVRAVESVPAPRDHAPHRVGRRPVIVLPGEQGFPRQRRELGRCLWDLLAWKVITTGIDHLRPPPAGPGSGRWIGSH
jgi:hypothetical protein